MKYEIDLNITTTQVVEALAEIERGQESAVACIRAG